MPLLERLVHSFLFSFDYINHHYYLKNKIEIFQTATEWKSEKLTNSWWKNEPLHTEHSIFTLTAESSIIIVVEKLRMKEFTNRKVKVKNMRKKIFLTLQSIPFLSLCCWTPLWRPALARMWSPFAWKWLRIMWSAVNDFFFTIWVGNWSFGKL